MRRQVSAFIASTLVGFMAMTGGVRAQERGKVEVSAKFGVLGGFEDMARYFELGIGSTGVRYSPTSKSDFKWMAGGSVGVYVADNLMARFDVDYNRIAKASYILQSGKYSTSADFSVYMTNFTGGIEYSFKRDGAKIVPFVGGGLGMLRLTASGSSSTSISDVSASEHHTTYYAGAGLSLMGNKNWGIRPDFRYYRIPDRNYYRGSISFIYQFGKSSR